MKSACSKIKSVVLLVWVFSLIVSCTSKSKILDPVVQTESGLVQGVANASATVTSFKGIPYAAPPVGDLRWKEPQPPLAWEGIRDASEFCASCIQEKQGSRLPWTEEFMVQNDISEDCLFLNIWTPARTAEDKLAVLVYIHGGGFVEGSGAIVTYDGDALARKGIVVVTINYRLGALGFLAHPDLTAESPHKVSGNYGLLDQVVALKWIQDNIAAFGGDPGRVTIAGQSAGAMSVQDLTVSPLAKGLFHGAITQSGASYSRSGSMTRLAEAETMGVDFTSSKGATSIADLRAMLALEVIKNEPGQPYFRFGTVVDGYFLTGSYMDIFAEGKQNDTPYMTGMNRDELRYGGEKSKAYYDLYLADAGEDSALAETTAAREYSRLNAWLWMDHRSKTARTKGYIYYFTQAIPWPEHPEFGAFHTGDVPYFFNNLSKLDRPWTTVDTLVADRMSSYWANYVKTGDPNGDELPDWSAFDPGKKEVMELGEEMGMILVAANEERFDFLKGQILGD